MRKGFLAHLERVIAKADLVLEVVDARFPIEARNRVIERRVTALGKKWWIVFNKRDLVPFSFAKKWESQHNAPHFWVSASSKKGVFRLRNALLAQGDVWIGIVGYPNSGKSSLINALVSRRAARVSSQAGFTRGEQITKGRGLKLLDSPGIIPYDEQNESLLALWGAKNPQALEDPEPAAMLCLSRALELYGPVVEKQYGVPFLNLDSEEWLGAIARFRGRLQKKGEPDTRTMAVQVILDWQRGKFASRKP